MRLIRTATIICLVTLGIQSIFAQTNPKPNIIPSVRLWSGATGRLSVKNIDLINDSKTVEADSIQILSKIVEQELSEFKIKNTQGIKVKFVSSLPESLKGKSSAYQLIIANDITINADSYSGYLYATRTLLQMISQNKTTLSIPKGTVGDYATLEARMMMLDVARKYFPVEELKNYIRTMAWVKMNELHLHLNDNSWGLGDAYWRLPSDKYPNITSKEHYTWAQIKELVDFAGAYGITLTPEIDTPGHSRSLVFARPDVKSPHHPSSDQANTFIDIKNPEAIQMVKDLIAEIIPHFPAPDFHIGTDEYMLKSIKDSVLKAELAEGFIVYMNELNEFVKSKGKVARAWTGYEYNHAKATPSTDIVIDMWDSQDPRAKSEGGYKFINSSDVFNYIVPGNIIKRYNTDHKWVYENWNPRIFSREASKNLLPENKGLVGAKFNVWNDYAPAGPFLSEISRQVVHSMMTFSEKMWGTQGFKTYQRAALVQRNLMGAPLTGDFLKEEFRDKKVVYRSKAPINMTAMNKSVPLGALIADSDLTFPWVLEATILRTARSEKDRPEVILTSEDATLYAYLNHVVYLKDGLKDEFPGITLVRAHRDYGNTPYTSGNPQVLTFKGSLPLAKEVKLKIVGEFNHTAVYIDGQLVGEFSKQSVLPLMKLGSDQGENFKGIIQSLVIYNYVPKTVAK